MSAGAELVKVLIGKAIADHPAYLDDASRRLLKLDDIVYVRCSCVVDFGLVRLLFRKGVH